MHIHQSMVDAKTGKNIFSTDGRRHSPCSSPTSPACRNTCRRRWRCWRRTSIPTAAYGAFRCADQRAVGLRQPHRRLARAGLGRRERAASRTASAGADANPYIAIAASLACGYLGMVEGLEPTEPIKGSAHRLPYTLPRRQSDAINKFNDCKPLREIFGERFIAAVTMSSRPNTRPTSASSAPGSARICC